jgi:hypothetical protein
MTGESFAKQSPCDACDLFGYGAFLQMVRSGSMPLFGW